MTFEQLRDRHEALTMNLELMIHQSEEHNKQLAEHTKQLTEHTKQLLLDGEHIRALARIAEIHERRISHIEETGE